MGGQLQLGTMGERVGTMGGQLQVGTQLSWGVNRDVGHVHVHMHTHVCTRAHMHTHTCTYTCAHLPMPMHGSSHKVAPAVSGELQAAGSHWLLRTTQVRTGSHRDTQGHTGAHTHAHTHAHTDTHTHTQTHTHVRCTCTHDSRVLHASCAPQRPCDQLPSGCEGEVGEAGVVWGGGLVLRVRG